MRVIETILASFIIVAALSFVGVFAVNPPSSGYEMTDLERMGYSALHDLDQQGVLVSLVYNVNWGDLRTALKITLPVDVYFDLKVYDLSGSRLNGEQIIYGDTKTFSSAKNIASVSYSLVGIPRLNVAAGTCEADYSPRILVLQLTKG